MLYLGSWGKNELKGLCYKIVTAWRPRVKEPQKRETTGGGLKQVENRGFITEIKTTERNRGFTAFFQYFKYENEKIN